MKFAKQCRIISIILIMSLTVTACSIPGQVDEPAPPAGTAEETASPNTEDPDSNLGQWARAMGSVLMHMNNGNLYYFGGYDVSEYNAGEARKILEQSWSIKNRKQLLRQIKQLIKGESYAEYIQVAKEVNSYTAKQLEEILSQLPESTSRYYSLVQYNWDKWQKRGVLAWDLCRVSLLAQWGFLAGYITIEEAQAVIEPAARKLQKKFTSWEDVQMNWLDGYAWWAEIDTDDGKYLERKEAYEEVVANQETEGLLYDDSLFVQDIVPIKDVSYKDLFAEVKTKKAKAATGSAIEGVSGAATGSAIKKKKKKSKAATEAAVTEDAAAAESVD